jgi:methylenetetrahydrofolate reductase (NADPH)
VIDSGLLHARCVTEVDIAGYPDGHPRLAAIELDRAIVAKVEGAAATGLAVHIVTQFGFSAPAVAATLNEIRAKVPPGRSRVGRAPADHSPMTACWRRLRRSRSHCGRPRVRNALGRI